MRQLCNVAYSVMAEGRDETELEQLDIEIGMIDNPAEIAVQELRRHQDVMGMEFKNPDAPVSADPSIMSDLPDEFLR